MTMRERPIIFNADMVRAVLDGRKTQTRRIVNGVPSSHDFHGWILSSTSTKDEGKACWAIGKSPLLNKPIRVRCPFGEVDDRLWVRETFATLEPGSYEPVTPHDGYAQIVRYAASDRLANSDRDVRGFNWRPSIHMPRWASRITLEITGVRVERLQDISHSDAKSEGCWYGRGGGEPDFAVNPSDHFPTLWASIYGEESWQANPWVWVIEFKRVEVE